MITTLQLGQFGRSIVSITTSSGVTFDTTHSDGVALSNGNLTADIFTGLSAQGGRADSTTSYSSGKHYCEFLITQIDLLNGQPFIGLHTPGVSGGPSWPNPTYAYGPNGFTYPGADGGRPTYGASDIIALAFDADAAKLWFAVNNAWILSGDPSTGSNPVFSPAAASYCASVGCASLNHCIVTAHFALADFVYTPPTGFGTW